MVLSMICKCLNKMACVCTNFLNTPLSQDRISEKDLAEWKRIEGIDQYNKKRH